jgi:O-methyltransferase
MSVEPPAIAATAEFSEWGAPVRVDLARQGGDTTRIKFDWEGRSLVAVRIEGAFANDADQIPVKTRQVFTVRHGRDRAAWVRHPSAAVAYARYSEAGAPVHIVLEATDDTPAGKAGDTTQVRFDWNDDTLTGVRLEGSFLHQPEPAPSRTHQVFTVRREGNRTDLIMDPSVLVARVEHSATGVPVRIVLDPPHPRAARQRGATVVEFDWQDGMLNGLCVSGDFPAHADRTDAPIRRVYRAQHQPNEVALSRDPAAIPAIVAYDGHGVPVTIKLVETTITAPATPSQTDATEEMWRRRRATRLYRARRSRTGTVLDVADIPPYYVSGFSKKLDVREAWSAPFGTVADTILAANKTLLGHDRLYTLWQAVRNIAHLSAPIVEVGVWRGGSSALIAAAQRHFGKRGAIYACDTFTGHPRIDPDRDSGHVASHPDARVPLKEVEDYLGDHPDVRVVAGDIVQTAATIADRAIAMMHLDVDVYPATRFCLEEFVPRLAPDGVIVIDDYGFTSCPGVKSAVDEFLAANSTVTMMHLLTGQALLCRRKGANSE